VLFTAISHFAAVVSPCTFLPHFSILFQCSSCKSSLHNTRTLQDSLLQFLATITSPGFQNPSVDAFFCGFSTVCVLFAMAKGLQQKNHAALSECSEYNVWLVVKSLREILECWQKGEFMNLSFWRPWCPVNPIECRKLSLSLPGTSESFCALHSLSTTSATLGCWFPNPETWWCSTSHEYVVGSEKRCRGSIDTSWQKWDSSQESFKSCEWCC
jgi:hypothetical protein